ncbi:hypothetical protein [Nocardia sp. NPDC060249]|uniref:hypothetical protein n=1 Tax=Nocardia sp. NPDC060249 TaxID=3347082 RepID=UPI00364A629B
MPADLTAALQIAQLSTDHLSGPELEQMVEMIVEARVPAVRSARVEAVVAAIAAAIDPTEAHR